jgi:tetratricopeptide (TPR) repeat protein
LEIEYLVKDGRYEDAISHCQNILKSYPKNVATYKLLAKAYLETRQYAQSKDIYQRVLSSIPDDCLSHVGMSVIFENEGDLSKAIWHMERAYESHPGDKSNREALGRLYGKRDGVSPPKVRLTTGALIKLYIKGELYQQAISEIHSALAQDQTRLDLKVLLAYAYMKTGQSAEAVETSNDILRNLPYCLEANRIMWIVLSDNDRKDEAQIYLSHLEELDPYYQHTDATISTPGNIPEGAIIVERIKGTDDSIIEELPQGEVIESAVEGENDEDIPEWLHAIEPDDQTVNGLGEIDSEDLPGADESFGEEIHPTKHTDWQEEFDPDSLIDGDTQPIRVAPSSEPQPETTEPVVEAKDSDSSASETVVEIDSKDVLIDEETQPEIEGISSSEEVAGGLPEEKPVSPESESEYLQEKETKTGESAPEGTDQGDMQPDSEIKSDEDESPSVKIPDWLRELTQENETAPDEPESFLNSDKDDSINKSQSDQSGRTSNIPDWLKNQSES